MTHKARHAFDDDAGPAKPDGTPSNPQPTQQPQQPQQPSGAQPSGAQTSGVQPVGAPRAPGAPGTSGLKRITSLIPAKPAPVVAPAPDAAANPAAAAAAAPAATPGFLQAGAGLAADLDPHQPRSTTISSVVDAEMGSTFISGRIKLQVLHFPALKARYRVLIVNEVPGTQQNLDLAEQLWLKGYEVAILHNRGEAGSDGLFSLKGIERDVRQASQQTVETGHRDRLWKSIAPVVLVGSGVAAPGILGIAAEDERLGGVVLIEPYLVIPRITELGDSPIQPAELHRHMQAGVMNMIGRELLNDEWDYLAQFRNPIEMAGKGGLSHMPILHVTAEKSVLAEMGRQFSTVLKSKGAPLYNHVHMHGSSMHFWRNRQELIHVVSLWIEALK